MTTKERWDERFANGQDFGVITEAELDTICSAVDSSSSALDLACGTGDLVLKLARRGLSVTGVDISSVGLELARKRLESEGLSATFFEADLNSVDLSSSLQGPFDFIFIKLAFSFVNNREVLLEQIKKLLSPSGVFVCILPVLLPEGIYDQRQHNISLPRVELEDILRKHFSSVDIVSEDLSVQSDWPLATYLCRP